MSNFWDYNVWSFILIIGALLGSLFIANMLKKALPFLQKSLIPTSVLGGLTILVISFIYKLISGNVLFNEAAFGGNGMNVLEIVTYHALALGFIASAFKTNGGKITKRRSVEIINTGVTTVSTYLLQAIFGLGITIIASYVISNFFVAAGVLLPFGYGQGTGQALNYGKIYQADFGFESGESFGLTIAALGFLSAAIGGVFHLNLQKRRGKMVLSSRTDGSLHTDVYEDPNEIPMQESVDKFTVQIALIVMAYLLTYFIMWGLGSLLPGMKAIIYGFNFLLGVLSATLIKVTLNFLNKKGIVKRKHTNNFLMTRASNFFFDLMVVAGIAAIRLDVLENYWGIIIILGFAGLIVTYIYNRIVAKTLFGDYAEEQFLTMYGMLTGTASTGIILLREVDGEFKTPASDNLVYQNFPAIVLGFPMMFLATLAPVRPYICLLIFVAYFIALNVFLFRSKIFKTKSK
ncbi:MAG: hypothetical protein J6V66_06245 [Clostridia bacterium]|nr:hypothetical protein [Clostridia bacterium]